VTGQGLVLDGVAAGYGPAEVLSGIDLRVEPGACVALLGRNGAGKSTTLKTIIALVPPRAGRISFRGASLAGLRPHDVARRGIGYVPEERRIFAGLTVAENLAVGARGGGPGPRWSRERVVDLFPVLGRLADRPGGQLSGGEQQMLAIARTLMGSPALLLLDEPTEGLAPLIVAELARVLAGLRAEGVAILLAEQNLRFAARLADHAYVLESGRMRYQGTMAALAADHTVQRTLLGVGAEEGDDG